MPSDQLSPHWFITFNVKFMMVFVKVWASGEEDCPSQNELISILWILYYAAYNKVPSYVYTLTPKGLTVRMADKPVLSSLT
jgi:hypothetical protein